MRDMTNMSHEQARASGWEIAKEADFEVIAKAVYDESNADLRIMKSTKRLSVPGGWIYTTSTEVHKEGKISVAEAMVFVPQA